MSRCSVAGIFADNALDLVEWIYLRYPNQALKILRERIVFESEPTGFEQALIKVAAKRWAVESFAAEANGGARMNANIDDLYEMRIQNLKKSTENYSDEVGVKFSDLKSAGEWVKHKAASLQSFENPKLFVHDRPIVAAAFDKNFRLVAAARNTNSRIRTRHAEMNLLEHLNADLSTKGIIGSGLILVVSLQSCRMCAAAIRNNLISHDDVKIYYIDPEPSLANVKTELFGFEIKVEI